MEADSQSEICLKNVKHLFEETHAYFALAILTQYGVNEQTTHLKHFEFDFDLRSVSSQGALRLPFINHFSVIDVMKITTTND